MSVALPRWAVDLTGRARSDNCWGLCAEGLAHLGVELPRYEGSTASAAERAEVARMIASEADDGPWDPIPLDDVRLGDVLVFRVPPENEPSHVGLALVNGLMLHAPSKRPTEIITWRSGPWCRRLVGAYRYRK